MNGERVDTVVIGGGQAGLAVGCHLARHGRDCAIPDAQDRVSDSWRRRWDSLRLFTPSGLTRLPGMPFPGRGEHVATKDEMADYLAVHAARFALAVQLGVRVEAVTATASAT